jgi:hypothetical protein
MDMLDEWFAGCCCVIGSMIKAERSIEGSSQMVKISLGKTQQFSE